MKVLLNPIASFRTFATGGSITWIALLLAASPVNASTSTPFASTNWLVAVPAPGVLCTNAAGQVSLKGNVHVLRVQADDARVTGRLQAGMDLAYQADGTAIFTGQAYAEVGTWDLADPLNPKFTPTGGVWQLDYQGAAQADGSDRIHMVGYGIGGAIDGLRIDLTTVKGPGAPFDPAVPYVAAGTVKTAAEIRMVLDDFNDNRRAGWVQWSRNDLGTITETNGQFTVRGYWPGVHTTSVFDSWSKGWISNNWTVADGQSLEWRVDLVAMNESTSIAYLGLGSFALARGYVLGIGHGFIGIGKETATAAILLACERTSVRESNVTLSLTLSRVQTNLVITARLFDRQNPEAVLFERTVVDTPLPDPSLTTAEFEAITGMHLLVNPDPKAPPTFSFDNLHLEIFQCNDGTRPAAVVTYDNLELRTYEVPLVGIERAVRLAWPKTGINFDVEAAPTVNGPWLPVRSSVPPGLQQVTVPAGDGMQFFRLQPAP